MRAFLALTIVALLAGCSGGEAKSAGYEAKDFQKSTPPPEYRGPGQPGGPPTGAPSGPPTGTTTG
ncbi:hypothetical protein EON79_02040 [bacterium]|nr:MAG: hypothetical protein EON79_02040 [bacterium]